MPGCDNNAFQPEEVLAFFPVVNKEARPLENISTTLCLNIFRGWLAFLASSVRAAFEYN